MGRPLTSGGAGRLRTFVLPDLGEGLTEALIVEWLVEVGDQVAVDQPVVRVQTAKAEVELPSPHEGAVATRHGAPGDTVVVGAPLVSIASGDTGARAGEGEGGGGEGGTSRPGQGPDEPGRVLVGYGAARETRSPRRHRRQGPGSPAVPAPGTGSPPDPAGLAEDAEAGRAVISPVVRRLARDHDLDLDRLAGTGPAGLITRRDVEAAISSQQAAPPVHAPVPRRVALAGLRRATAEKLARSRREIPEATVWVDVDATGLLEARRAIDAANVGAGVGVLALLARFCVAGLIRHPELNAHFDNETDEHVVFPDVHLGLAAQTDRGLVVPVVREAQRLSVVRLAGEIRRLAEEARAGSLPPGALLGGTFTLNNYGVFGVDGSAAIINHPEVAILGLGRIIDRPWVVDGELAVRQVAQLTLAFDHRACDGGTAGRFLRFVADCVERPLAALGQL
ncbi:MAG: dihydrolipoamide acetyltransferase family protein [Acidimicrobiales bacterium]